MSSQDAAQAPRPGRSRLHGDVFGRLAGFERKVVYALEKVERPIPNTA